VNHKSVFAAAVAFGLAAGGLAACSGEPSSSEESVLRVAIPLAPEAMSFGLYYYPAWLDIVYDRLWYETDGADFAPGVATSWEYSDDRKELTVQLRDDHVFADGTPLDADAVKAVFDEFFRTDKVGTYLDLAPIDSIEVTGEYSLVFHLSRAEGTMLKYLERRVLVNPAALGDVDALTLVPQGSGPYLYDVDGSDESGWIFTRNPDHPDPERWGYDRIEFVPLADNTARLNALKSGQVDITPLDAGAASEAESSGFAIEVFNRTWAGLYLGDRRGEIVPAMGDVRVRQAISMALDRVSVAETLDGGLGDPSSQLGVEGDPEGYYAADRADAYAYDLEAAKELLADAGYADGFDIDIPYNENSALWASAYLPYLRQALEELGIRVNWVQLGNDEIFPAIIGGTYAAYPVALGYTDDSYTWYEDGLWNPWRNWDDETAELLDEINSGTSDEARMGARTRLSEKMIDEAWFAIVAHPPAVWAYSTDVAPNLTPGQSGGGTLQLMGTRPAD
jgi:peptide/nickel transport system substrate-binding protein